MFDDINTNDESIILTFAMALAPESDYTIAIDLLAQISAVVITAGKTLDDVLVLTEPMLDDIHQINQNATTQEQFYERLVYTLLMKVFNKMGSTMGAVALKQQLVAGIDNRKTHGNQDKIKKILDDVMTARIADMQMIVEMEHGIFGEDS